MTRKGNAMHWRLQKILHRARNFHFLVEPGEPWINPGFHRSCLLRRSIFTEQFEKYSGHTQSRVRLVISRVTSTIVSPGMPKEIGWTTFTEYQLQAKTQPMQQRLFFLEDRRVCSAQTWDESGRYTRHIISRRTHRDSEQEELNLNLRFRDLEANCSDAAPVSVRQAT